MSRCLIAPRTNSIDGLVSDPATGARRRVVVSNKCIEEAEANDAKDGCVSWRFLLESYTKAAAPQIDVAAHL